MNRQTQGQGLMPCCWARRRALLLGSTAVVVVAAGGVYLYLRKKRQRRLLELATTSWAVSILNAKSNQKALLSIARYYGGLSTGPSVVTVQSINSTGLTLSVTAFGNATQLITVAFSYPVKDEAGTTAAVAELYRTAAAALNDEIDSDVDLLLTVDPVNDQKIGLAREEMGKEKLAGTVKMYDTHLFVLEGHAAKWSKHADEQEGSLAKALAAAVKERKQELVGKVKVNVAEPLDDSEEGGVLVFPHQVLVKGITLGNAGDAIVACFGKQVKGALGDVAPQGVLGLATEAIPRHHMFICSHLKRDKRCGVIGPYLIHRARAIIEDKGLQCPVRACSHVGGHAYAGNVLTFSRRDAEERLVGDWFGYVRDSDLASLVESVLMKGEVVKRLWRGRMGLSEEEQRSFAACDGCACGEGSACG